MALGTLQDGRLEYAPVNACICLLGMIDGKELVAVETWPGRKARCTRCRTRCSGTTAANALLQPGIVMSLFTLYPSKGAATDRR